MEILNDLTGKKSSKRLAGLSCIGAGLIIGIGSVVLSAFDNTANIQLVDIVITTIFTAGTILLGASIAEHLKNNKEIRYVKERDFKSNS
jgi:hypothetical protein